VLYTVNAKDDDGGDDGVVTYRMIQPAVTSPFLLNSVTGELTLKSRLDRETLDTYVMILEARDSSPNSSLTSTVTFTYSVDDVNDNPPRCQSEVTHVPSGKTPGYLVTNLNCTDLDVVGGVMTFFKVGGDASGVFEVVSSNGKVKLASLPSEPLYVLLVEVRDGGSPELTSTTAITITVDIALRFQNLPDTVRISEDASRGTSVFTARTDGSLLPTFSLGNLVSTAADGTVVSVDLRVGVNGSPFTIEPSTGKLFLTSKLNRETITQYTVEIVAKTDQGQLATSTLSVSVSDVNDNAPVISGVSFNVSVMEDVSVSHVLASFSARDPDLHENGSVTFTIVSGNEDNRFALTAGDIL
jgi:hypothetical protein